jgi:hypothetical protein
METKLDSWAVGSRSAWAVDCCSQASGENYSQIVVATLLQPLCYSCYLPAVLQGRLKHFMIAININEI